MTDAERWRRVQDLCEALDDVPEEQWATRLRAMEGDGALRDEALALREALRQESAFVGPAKHRPAVVPLPEVVGGVRVEARLGAGGSGEVFRGVRTVNGVEQAVAVKRFHLHRAEGADLERVAREQQMLAALSHPDIVRLIDAGVDTDGRPFLVMDLAAGDPITAWCDERKLPLDQRLRLFLAVCDAVQSAHRHLIVHLDLKPGNILVTADGRPKLLDFGTAKLAGPDLHLTSTEPLTLQYASPERLRGEAVSVACDVYSLGLILFELVSGSWPFRRHESLVAVAERASGATTLTPLPRVITEEAALRRAMSLERLRGAVRGDLEAITTRALAHEARDRYATVAELADDVRRYLDGEPVRAHTPGVGYRLGKFLRRHALETASVTLLVVGLAAATAYSVIQARASARAAERAEAQNSVLARMLMLPGNDATAATSMTVRDLLTLADDRVLPTLQALPDLASDVERVMGQAWIAQGDFATAASFFDRALERAAATSDVPRQAHARALRAYTLYVTSHAGEATNEARAALQLWNDHAPNFTPVLASATLAQAATVLAYVSPASEEAAPYFEACLRVSTTLPSSANTARPICLFGLAAVRFNAQSDFASASQLLDETAALQRADPTMAASLGTTLQLAGLVRRATGRFAEDEALQRESLTIVERLTGPESVGALWQRAVWATSLVGAGRADEAYRESMAVVTAARRLIPQRAAAMLWTPLSAASTAACYLERDDCEALTREALDTLGPNPAPNDARARTARGLLGLALAKRGRMDEARPMMQAALDGAIASKRSSVFLPRWRAALAAAPPAP
ncbi:MAG: serine/threonine-protein kinase [Vicinamibacterales bacterium]